MKFLRLIIVIAILALPMVALAQNDSMVVDTTIVTPSPIDFNKVLDINSLAKYFGAAPGLFAIFVGMIFVLTELVKQKVKLRGELFFVDNRSIVLPFIIGIFLAFISPTGFGFLYTIRFGFQGAVAATIIYMLGSFVFGGGSRRSA
ncbi:MAG: hypothetical protein WBP29_11250 [Candidatus Zixiibacteriota bacterium]